MTFTQTRDQVTGELVPTPVLTDAERDQRDWFEVRNGLKSLLMVLMERYDLTRHQALEWLGHARMVNDLRVMLARDTPPTEGGP